jgi:hypothetical protein
MRRRVMKLLRRRESPVPAEPTEPTCYFCGRPVEEALARLGSISCHDCRPAHTQQRPARVEA